MFKIFGYKTCVVQAGVIIISFGTFSLSALLRTFGIKQNWGKAYRSLCANSVEMHQLHGCEDLVFKQSKLVSNVIDGIQTNSYRENSLFGKLS